MFTLEKLKAREVHTEYINYIEYKKPSIQIFVYSPFPSSNIYILMWSVRMCQYIIDRLIVSVQFSSVQSLSHVQLFATLWNAACKVPMPFTISWSLLKFTCIELVCSNSCLLSRFISSSATPFFCLQSFPASGSFPMSQLFASGSQSLGASASALVLLLNIED